jgi:hypothetical protein
MSATIDYLEMIKEKYRLDSDNKAAMLLQTKRGTVSCWRNRKNQADEAIAIKMAQLLDLPIEMVMADIKYESSKDELVKDYWARKSAEYHESA